MSSASICGRSHELDVCIGDKQFHGNYRVANGVLRVFYKLSCLTAPIDEKLNRAAPLADSLLRRLVEADHKRPQQYDYSLSQRESF